MRATKFPWSKKRLRTMFREWPTDAWLRRVLSRSGRSPRWARSRLRRQRVSRRAGLSDAAVGRASPVAATLAIAQDRDEAWAEAAGSAAGEAAASSPRRSRGARRFITLWFAPCDGPSDRQPWFWTFVVATDVEGARRARPRRAGQVSTGR